MNAKTQVYNNLHEDDFVVTFASSTIKIYGIILIPVFADGHVIGVLELGSTSILKKTESAILKNAA
jgi:putative methionine-R-sulfoxide reductase with GAF domain